MARSRSGIRAVAFALVFFSSFPLAAQDDVPEVVRERIEEGDRHREAGRFEEAIASYREARRLGPEVLEVYASLGALYVGREDLDGALEAFTAGLAVEPDDRQLLFNAAVVAMRLGRYEEALGHVERALVRHRGDGDLSSLHGAVLTRLERPQDALAALETAAQRKPGDPQIHFRLGNLHHQLGQREQAAAAFRKAIKKDRGLLRAYYNLGAVLVELERYDQALDAYLTALEPLDQAFAAGQPVDPEHARAYQNLGAIYFQRGEWRLALDAYTKALRLDSELSVALYNQGYIHFTLGDFDAAERAYERALALDSELPLAYLHLGRIRQRKGELEAAVASLTAGLSRLEGKPRVDALRALAGCQEELGRIEAAEQAYRAVLEAVPEDLPVRLSLGRLLRRAGRLEEARRELEEARRIAPGHAGAGLELAALARADGRTADEKRLYEDLLRGGADLKLWPVRLNLALLLLRQGQTVEARPHLEALARLKPTDKQNNGLPGAAERKLIATVHGLLLALDGDLAASRKRLHAVLGEDADFAAAADVLAVVGALSDPAAAVPALAASFDRARGGALELLARANFGQALWLAERSGDAREHLEAAATAFPRWLSVQAALGDVTLGEGRYDDAVIRLAGAVELCGGAAPESPLGAPPDGFFSTTIAAGGAAAAGQLCKRLRTSLGLARAGAALERLEGALSGGGLGAVEQLAARALDAPLPADARSAALFVRGTARLTRGDDERARADLERALAGPLAAALRPRASNNLGVALTRLGRVDEARAAYEAASPAFAEATLNLGILLEDHAGDPRAALDQYRAYLSRAGAAGAADVERWIERLERIYG